MREIAEEAEERREGDAARHWIRTEDEPDEYGRQLHDGKEAVRRRTEAWVDSLTDDELKKLEQARPPAADRDLRAELTRVCNSDAARRARFGPEAAAALHRRLGQMAAANHLADLHHPAAARLRPDPADNGISRVVSLGDHGHLVVRPREDPPAAHRDGTLDEHSVRALIVTAIAITR
ncbi:hypothetical protein [Streptomyces scabiei]|uniref:hypothetical protein n=4 Tax=Streptomyces scabiei TaxID=1930 RepID=UPI000AEC8B8A|nr:MULTISPECIES: hypothetical protein [Streptomyces]MDX2540196.1 hypothetical protein [Streptomyces scabiei]MDX2688285.1 hypothetical protein [Streptomyces scabiei]MDX2756559.1 hypothetical protein [Streptomyces scabiei]MDX2810657.1 hypothetical protein [Streptomyces scabiei]MDX3127882.1 hypothetical protein [Streptomyces scabiei]